MRFLWDDCENTSINNILINRDKFTITTITSGLGYMWFEGCNDTKPSYTIIYNKDNSTDVHP